MPQDSGRRPPRYPHNEPQSSDDAGQSGYIREAVTRFRDVVERRTRTLGSDHPETLIARKNLGEGLSRTQRPAESAEHFKEVAEGWAHVRGADHDSVWDLRYRRASCYGKPGSRELRRTSSKRCWTLPRRPDSTGIYGSPRCSGCSWRYAPTMAIPSR
ncbi:tetratricopeptide repeat protein [Streptomyces sp. SID7803]|nr:tetratricopeptide repeat protein [Streptomyces sp. SID7803]